MARFTVGQHVLLVSSYNARRHEPRSAHVVKIGRKYAYVRPDDGLGAWQYEKTRFFLVDGREENDYPGQVERIVEPEVYAHEQAAKAAQTRLNKSGLTFDYGSKSIWTAERIIALDEWVAALPGQGYSQ